MKIHSVKYNFAMNFALSVSSFIFPLITFPYASRVLTAEGVGAVSFAASFVSYFTLIASLGVPTYGIRACAEVREDKDELCTVVQELLIILTATTLLTVIAYLSLIQFVPRLSGDKVLFCICGLGIVFNALGANWFFQSIEQYDYITIRSIAFKVVSLVLLLMLVHEYADYYLYAAITVLAGAGSCVLNVARLVRLGVLKKRRRYCIKRHIKPILILFAQSATTAIYTNLDTVMLGLMKSNAEVGYYYIAAQLKQLFLTLITSLANVLLPRMTVYASKQDNEKFFATMGMGLNFSLLVALPVAFYFFSMGAEAIYLIAGTGYDNSVIPTQILLFALIPIGLTQVIGVQVLTPLKREKQVLASVAVGALVNVILNLVLIPQLGAIGTAAATLAAESIVLVMQLHYARALMQQVRKDVHPLRYLVAAALSSAGCSLATSLIADSLLLLVILGTTLFAAIYFAVLLVAKDPFVIQLLTQIRELAPEVLKH